MAYKESEYEYLPPVEFIDESRPYRKRFYILLFLCVLITYLHMMQDSYEFTTRTSPLSHQVVVITGASSGIGLELSKRLVEDGFDVFGTYRSEKDRVMLEKNKIHPLYMELTKPSTITDAESTVKKYLDANKGNKEFLGIVANAGVLNAGPYERVEEALLLETVDVHLKGTMMFVKAFMGLVQSAKGGRVIIMGSLAAVLLPPANAAYNAAKAGQHAFALSLREELAALDTSVSLIICGETRGTQLHEKRKTKTVDWSRGYDVFQRTFELGSKWMGESILGTTFQDLHIITKHALTAKSTRAYYYAPPYLEYVVFFTPSILIQRVMRTPPPDFLFSKADTV